jgi:hypothetical protein
MDDAEGFRDLYSAAYGPASWVNISAITDIDRDLTKSYWEIDELLSDQTDQFIEKLPQTSVAQFGRNPIAARAALNHYRDELASELRFLSAEICSTLRTKRTKDWANANLDLSNTYLLESDCTSSDFSYVDLSSARIERVDLSRANLEPTAFSNSTWIESPWWKAKTVAGSLLVYLKEQNYPYRAGGEYSNGDSVKQAPNKADYLSRVTILCKADGITCDLAKIPFGSPSSAPKSP